MKHFFFAIVMISAINHNLQWLAVMTGFFWVCAS